jgi:hypothetical protein
LKHRFSTMCIKHGPSNKTGVRCCFVVTLGLQKYELWCVPLAYHQSPSIHQQSLTLLVGTPWTIEDPVAWPLEYGLQTLIAMGHWHWFIGIPAIGIQRYVQIASSHFSPWGFRPANHSAWRRPSLCPRAVSSLMEWLRNWQIHKKTIADWRL